MEETDDLVWDGITLSRVLSKEQLRLRHALADAARAYDWPQVLVRLAGNPELVNTTRPDGSSLFAPLHQAAHGGAPVEVAERLIAMTAWRTLRNARGERPVDVAERSGHRHLRDVLTPRLRHEVPAGFLLRMQEHFHAVIRGRIERALPDLGLRLPELEPLLESDRPRVWFAVPGMYGGFRYWLESDGVTARLITESWCRVAEGSGQRHEIDSAGSRLVAEGFV